MWLLWIIGIVLVIRVVFKLYGRQIALMAQRRMLRMMEKQMKRQAEEFERNYAPDREQQVYADKEIKVSKATSQGQQDVSEDDIAEDVDFEEVKRP
jgi:23S rRNA G2445 N2-methylase RlmL